MAPKDKPDTGLVTSWLGRTFRAAATTARIGMLAAWGPFRRILAHPEEAEGLILENHEAMAQRILGALGHLKGALMKVGQMASYMDAGLPEPAKKILSHLQDSVPPMAPKVIDTVFRRELGKRPQELFAEWNPEPIAAASIGQVHRARLRDRTEVAVKVQYPGIERALKSDLKNASLVSSFASTVVRTDEIVDEVKTRLLEECDYRKEAENQREFARLYANDPEIVVPEVVPKFTSRRIFTSRFVPGQRFREFADDASQEQRNRAGRIIARMAFESIFRHRLFNADPHPGNYLFLDDGRVAFIDFGCVKRFTAAFIERWRELMRSVFEQDRARFESAVLDLKIALSRDFDFDYHYKLTLYLYRPWLYDRPFRYSHEYVFESFRVLGLENPNKLKTNIPRDLVFVNRLQWGLNSVLAMLDAEANWRGFMMDLLYGPDRRKWPPPFPPVS